MLHWFVLTLRRKIVEHEDFGDMPLEDFTHGLYKNVKRIAFAAEIIAGLFIVDFVLHYFILR